MINVYLLIKKNVSMILIFIGILVFSIISFYGFSYNERLIFTLKDKPNIVFLIFAIIFFFCFIFCLIMKNIPNIKINNIERIKYSYTIDIDGKHKVIIKQGDISSYNGDGNGAILLPANTSFDEKCITDINSALGSYFLKKHPDIINDTKRDIIDEARRKFSLSNEKQCADAGDTILLPRYGGGNTNILISAVTQDNPNIGIQANVMGIINSIKNSLQLCSENRYSSITMPILGTGHGGIEPKISIMLICIQYFFSIYHLLNHHVKELVIIVFDENKRWRNDIDDAVECVKKLISKRN
jgi:hypothetical protein